uniref:Uncharacterized protein n=1 Tax=Steinernema glaseri TaxID=37863 RepID=A0A1I7YMB9_9BILA
MGRPSLATWVVECSNTHAALDTRVRVRPRAQPCPRKNSIVGIFFHRKFHVASCSSLLVAVVSYSPAYRNLYFLAWTLCLRLRATFLVVTSQRLDHFDFMSTFALLLPFL